MDDSMIPWRLPPLEWPSFVVAQRDNVLSAPQKEITGTYIDEVRVRFRLIIDHSTLDETAHGILELYT